MRRSHNNGTLAEEEAQISAACIALLTPPLRHRSRSKSHGKNKQKQRGIGNFLVRRDRGSARWAQLESSAAPCRFQ